MIWWFLQQLVESIINAFVGKVIDQQFGEQHGVEEDLKKLQDSLANARLKINPVENLWLKDEGLQQRLKELLIGLKDAAYDADDLLDEFQYRILKQNIEQQGDEAGNRASSSSYSTPPPSKKLKTSLSSYTSGFFGKGDDDDNNDVQRMREIKGRLDDNSVALEKIYNSLGAEDDRGKKQLVSSESRQTSSFSTEPQFFGRDRELQELKDLLLDPEVASGQSGFSVLSIAGIGGIGKTTLAQEVFNDSSVEEYFELRIWVCVSENFDTARLTREIIEYVTEEKCDLPNFASLQKALKEKITTPERFLLVLDDVWNEDRHKWESLCAPLRSGKPGSKILVTTRSMKIADMVSDVDAIHLEGLDEESFWEFFKKCAFGSSNSGVHPHLEAMAKKMIYKLKGLPLAAKTLGGLLSRKLDEQHWESILDSEIWQLPQEENGVMPVLQLSYQHLPRHLKQCFAFCSLFPKDYRFSESKLISIWIAEGFIVPQGSIRMEELASNYFHELINRSFFQKSYGDTFVMHDLIHDLAELISVGEFYMVEKGKFHEIPSTIRHLSVLEEEEEEEEGMQTKISIKSSHDNKLRTLMLHNNRFLFDDDLLERLKNIRVLDLSYCDLEELPNNIGKLIHLRYLDLSCNFHFRRFPESLCDLYNLQTLILFGCVELESLPHGMMKLINLRKLDTPYGFIADQIKEIGKLTSLQNLYTFEVRKDNGQKLAELKGLNQLRGKLHITNLENVENKDEANIASLKSKKHLDDLVLEWTSLQESDADVNLNISEQVLESLQPHYNLRRLAIIGYNGARSPNWLHEQVYSRLEALHLNNCKRWNDLSVIGQLSQLKDLYLARIPVKIQDLHELFDAKVCRFFSQLQYLVLEGITMLEDLPNLGRLPCLEYLDIRSLPRVKMIGDKFFAATDQGSCFPRLHTLHFKEMTAWEEFYCSNDKNLFPCLGLLEISNCQKLRILPPLPSSIKTLELHNVGLVDCPRFWKVIDEGSSITNSAFITEFKELTSLQSLSIKECPKLMSMTQDEYIDFQLPPSITQLCLSNCENLSKLLPGCLHNLTSLRELMISNCPNLVSLPVEALLNLNRVTIKNCSELRSVEGLRMKSLWDLKITGCPKLLLSQGEAQTEKSSLLHFEIDDTKFMKQSLIKNILSSIIQLTISSSCEATMFEEDQESLQSLTSLNILTFSRCNNLQSLPKKLYMLTSLQILQIYDCPQIQSLPEKGLPPALTGINFCNCHSALEQQLERHLAEIKKSGQYEKYNYWESLKPAMDTHSLLLEITEVGKLTSLQNLSAFKVLKDNGHKLENVENKDEANITEFRSLGWLAESFMGALVEKATDLEQHEVEEDLKKLQDSLAHARLTISDIDDLRLKDEGLQQRLKELLIRLKDTAYDADDLLDEFQYKILKQQIMQQGDEAGNQASSSSYSTPPSKKIKTSSFSYASGLFGKGDDDDYDDDVQRMRKIKGTLDDISVALEKICSLRDRDTKDDDRVKKQLVSSASRHTSSFSTEPQLFGRDNELKKLKDLLLKPEVAYGQSGFSVLPIAGIGGIGKTTLAQEVFNDSSVKEYFDLRIWVCVSENFSTARLTREIIEYVTEEQCHLSNLASLQKALKEKIKPERFLLVLDDVWNEDRHKWEDLCAPLRSGKSGSKILVTTRSRRIADMVGDVDTIHLEGLDEKSFWEFFKKCAFGSSNSEIYHPHLEAIAKKMICMLKGLPLAAKTLGELLILKLDEQYWKSILDSEIWQLLLDFVLYSEKIY